MRHVTAVLTILRAPAPTRDRYGNESLPPVSQWVRELWPVYGCAPVVQASLDGDRDRQALKIRVFAPLEGPCPRIGDKVEIPAFSEGGVFTVSAEPLRWDRNPSVTAPRNLGLEVTVERHRR